MKYCRLCAVLPGMLVALTLGGCYTLQSTFGEARPDYSTLPDDTLRALAVDIERAVQNGERSPDISGRDGISLDSDRIRQALRTRAARIERLDELREAGFVWERADGLLYVLNSKAYKQATTRRDRDRNALLVSSENQNRWQLYEGIVKASNLAPRALPAVQRIFFDARLQVLPAGHLYEGPDGEPLQQM